MRKRVIDKHLLVDELGRRRERESPGSHVLRFTPLLGVARQSVCGVDCTSVVGLVGRSERERERNLSTFADILVFHPPHIPPPLTFADSLPSGNLISQSKVSFLAGMAWGTLLTLTVWLLSSTSALQQQGPPPPPPPPPPPQFTPTAAARSVSFQINGETVVLGPFNTATDLWASAVSIAEERDLQGAGCDSFRCVAMQLVSAYEAQQQFEEMVAGGEDGAVPSSGGAGVPFVAPPPEERSWARDGKYMFLDPPWYQKELVAIMKSAYSQPETANYGWRTSSPFDAGTVFAGKGTYGWKAIKIRGASPAVLRIGNYTSIGPDVEVFLTAEHRTDWVSTYPFSTFHPNGAGIAGSPASRGDVVIGSDCWIGAGASILSGVQIGHGAVVGAHAVVRSDVAPYAIVSGNPAKEVRKRFSEAEIERLVAVKWWEFDEELIDELVPLLSGPNVEAFLGKAEEIAYRARR